MAITLIITDAGLAEVINAQQNGTAPTQITQVGFGTGKYTATHEQTALQEEFKRLSTIAGGAISPNQIHVTARDGVTPNAYSVFEIGVYLASGTLFAVYSQTTPIIDKAAESSTMLAIDIELTGSLTPEMIEFGDTNFQLNSATEQHEGLVQLATVAEAKAGTDKEKAVTPEGVGAAITERVKTATESRTGTVQLATQAEAEAGTSNTKVPTVLRVAQAIAERVKAATESVAGIVRLATQAQARAGTNNTAAMTPLQVKDVIDYQRPYANQTQAEGGLNSTGMMTPQRTKQAIDYQRPIYVVSEGDYAGGTEGVTGKVRKWSNGRVEMWLYVSNTRWSTSGPPYTKLVSYGMELSTSQTFCQAGLDTISEANIVWARPDSVSRARLYMAENQVAPVNVYISGMTT